MLGGAAQCYTAARWQKLSANGFGDLLNTYKIRVGVLPMLCFSRCVCLWAATAGETFGSAGCMVPVRQPHPQAAHLVWRRGAVLFSREQGHTNHARLLHHPSRNARIGRLLAAGVSGLSFFALSHGFAHRSNRRGVSGQLCVDDRSVSNPDSTRRRHANRLAEPKRNARRIGEFGAGRAAKKIARGVCVYPVVGQNFAPANRTQCGQDGRRRQTAP